MTTPIPGIKPELSTGPERPVDPSFTKWLITDSARCSDFERQ